MASPQLSGWLVEDSLQELELVLRAEHPVCHAPPSRESLRMSTETGNLPYRSPREIPSFFIIAFNVVRGIPSRVAAALITPPVSRSTRKT
jgi:hypothetical protein